LPFDRVKAARQAERHLASGRTGKAIDEFLEMLEDNPGDVNLTNRLGDIYIQEGKPSEAIAMFKRAALAFEREGAHNKAIAIYKKALRAAPEDPETASRLIDLYKRSNMVNEAVRLHIQIADSYIQKGLTPRALKEFTKIVELDPRDVKNKIRLADLCDREGQEEQAAEIYLEAADMLALDKNYAQSNQVLERAKTLTAAPRLFLAQARLFAAQNDFVTAKTYLDEGLNANPKNAELLSAKAEIELLLNRPVAALEILAIRPQLSERALSVCERALKACQAQGITQNGLEIIRDNFVEMAKLGFGDSAKLTLHNALGTTPTPEYWLIIAEIALQNGDGQERVASLKQALNLLAPDDPRRDDVHKALAGLGVYTENRNVQATPGDAPQDGNLEREAQMRPAETLLTAAAQIIALDVEDDAFLRSLNAPNPFAGPLAIETDKPLGLSEPNIPPTDSENLDWLGFEKEPDSPDSESNI